MKKLAKTQKIVLEITALLLEDQQARRYGSLKLKNRYFTTNYYDCVVNSD